jgi:hypothetical protein
MAIELTEHGLLQVASGKTPRLVLQVVAENIVKVFGNGGTQACTQIL